MAGERRSTAGTPTHVGVIPVRADRSEGIQVPTVISFDGTDTHDVAPATCVHSVTDNILALAQHASAKVVDAEYEKRGALIARPLGM